MRNCTVSHRDTARCSSYDAYPATLRFGSHQSSAGGNEDSHLLRRRGRLIQESRNCVFQVTGTFACQRLFKDINASILAAMPLWRVPRPEEEVG